MLYCWPEESSGLRSLLPRPAAHGGKSEHPNYPLYDCKTKSWSAHVSNTIRTLAESKTIRVGILSELEGPLLSHSADVRFWVKAWLRGGSCSSLLGRRRFFTGAAGTGSCCHEACVTARGLCYVPFRSTPGANVLYTTPLRSVFGRRCRVGSSGYELITSRSQYTQGT